MSGIVGIFRRDGARVEPPLLRHLTDFLSFRGPDGLEVWADGSAGLGHAMLRATRESQNERQPANRDGQLWIVADARLDCRAELSEELKGAGRKCNASAPDPELLLDAYAAWGEECVHHLRGDFAFAIWNTRTKEFFCARDHFGIKPFFHTVRDGLFLFSNTLQCLRLHPAVSGELNEAAIADFLLFGLNRNVATTAFRDIQRLPAAHFLRISAGEIRIERYWSPPIDGRIRYRCSEDYIEHFQAVLQAAVADRLTTERTGIFLSGGLDSGAVAATARSLRRVPAEPGICARTRWFTNRCLQIAKESTPVKQRDFSGFPFDVWRRMACAYSNGGAIQTSICRSPWTIHSLEEHSRNSGRSHPIAV